MYRNVPMGPPPSALIGSALYSYPYPIPLLNPQTAYAIPAINPIYPQKLWENHNDNHKTRQWVVAQWSIVEASLHMF